MGREASAMMIHRAVAMMMLSAALSGAPVPRGWLGFTYYYRSSVSPPHDGFLVVADVAADGPAARAGLAPHDLVVAVNHKPLRYASDATAMAGISSVRPGQRIVLTVVRTNSRRDVSVTAAVMPEEEQRLWKKTLAAAAATRRKPH
jgi:S1-C subfamily serine protease